MGKNYSYYLVSTLSQLSYKNKLSFNNTPPFIFCQIKNVQACYFQGIRVGKNHNIIYSSFAKALKNQACFAYLHLLEKLAYFRERKANQEPAILFLADFCSKNFSRLRRRIPISSLLLLGNCFVAKNCF